MEMLTTNDEHRIRNRPRKKSQYGTKKPKAENPITVAVKKWLASTNPQLIESAEDALAGGDEDEVEAAHQRLIAAAPKKWVIYEPMALLPSGSFASEPWVTLLLDEQRLAQPEKDALWRGILAELSTRSPGRSHSSLTHLAVNEGIPLHVGGTSLGGGGGAPPDAVMAEATAASSRNLSPGEEDEGKNEKASPPTENILRSPSGLRFLHGDFGPSPGKHKPEAEDFDAAFWVSTRQNGIYQTWAPRWTMFSRGNIKEKARLLSFHDEEPGPAPTADTSSAEGDHSSAAVHHHRHRRRAGAREQQGLLHGAWALDLYAGIGYFAFSYTKLGMRVLCWELNPWSVEGLRRGAEGNGWGVRVVRSAEELARPTAEAVVLRDDALKGSGDDDDEKDVRIVVFQESNAEASRRVRELQGHGILRRIVHVNCGLLPTSRLVWEAALGLIAGVGVGEGGGEGEGGEGWLHLHENVGGDDIERRGSEIQELFDRWTTSSGDETEREGKDDEKENDGGDERRRRHLGGRLRAEVEHTELVKTWAPGVWHCVFDVYVTRHGSGRPVARDEG